MQGLLGAQQHSRREIYSRNSTCGQSLALSDSAAQRAPRKPRHHGVVTFAANGDGERKSQSTDKRQDSSPLEPRFRRQERGQDRGEGSPSTSARSSELSNPTKLLEAVGQELTQRWRSATAGKWAPGSCSPVAYLERSLRKQDRTHYAAAGILPYVADFEGGTGLYLLLGRQGSAPRPRGKREMFVLLGGKREARDASAIHTALREAAEETEGLLGITSVRKELLGPVVFYPQGKFALYLYPLPHRKLQELPERFSARIAQHRFDSQREVDSLEWVPAARALALAADSNDLIPGLDQMHPFTRSLLRCAPIQRFLQKMAEDASTAVAPTGPLVLNSENKLERRPAPPRDAGLGRGSRPGSEALSFPPAANPAALAETMALQAEAPGWRGAEAAAATALLASRHREQAQAQAQAQGWEQDRGWGEDRAESRFSAVAAAMADDDEEELFRTEAGSGSAAPDANPKAAGGMISLGQLTGVVRAAISSSSPADGRRRSSSSSTTTTTDSRSMWK